MREARIGTAAILILLVAVSGCESAAKKKINYTAESNPTARSGRGDPSLTDRWRPAFWILVDGHEGHFTKGEDGQPLLQWVIEEPVGSSPTFTVAAYEPLLGEPKDFSCVLQTVESEDGSRITYGISADPGTFEFGTAYSLLDPGDQFALRDPVTNDLVSKIPPLKPGTYLLAGKVVNPTSGAATAAVTYFTVEEPEMTQ